MKNLKRSDQAILFYVKHNKEINSFFNVKKKELILNKEFFNHPYEIVFRSLSDSLKLVGKMNNEVRGKKIDNIINNLRKNNSLKETLGGCVIKKVNQSVIISKEHKI